MGFIGVPVLYGITLHLDFAGPFMGKMFLIVFDSFSKWLEVYPMADIKTSSLVRHLRTSFSNHGIPLIIVTDNSSSFTSDEFKLFIEKTALST